MFKIAKEFSFDMAHMINRHDGKMNLLETITQLGQLNLRANKPKWQLSLQIHKIIGIE
jgi:organic radical activating enzyme